MRFLRESLYVWYVHYLCDEMITYELLAAGVKNLYFNKTQVHIEHCGMRSQEELSL